jgi:hypothetical protein
MTIAKLQNISNIDVANKLTEAWKVVESGSWGTGETIDNISSEIMTVERFLDHLITWYTLSDLSYKTVEQISINGFKPTEYTKVFTLILECYDITNSKSPEELISFLETNH